jgi:ParB/RepB/Spo0J family partition protein
MPEQLPDEFRPIPLDQIIEPWVILRVVNRESLEYLELRDSLAARGLVNSICVRPSLRKPGLYEVVDGLYRYTAASELRLPALPCIVKHNLTDEDVLALQIQANALRPETTAIEYARQIRRIMAAVAARQGRDATLADVSNLIHKDAEWVGDQLKLLHLRRDIQKAVERGEIPLGSAYMLAKLPMVHQARLVELAKTAPVREFAPIVAGLVKQIQENARQGKLHDFCKDFEPVPYLRPMKEVLAEYREHRLGGLALAKAGTQTAVDGWYLALQWALNLDEESVRQQREKFLARSRANALQRRVEPCDDNECPTFSMFEP